MRWVSLVLGLASLCGCAPQVSVRKVNYEAKTFTLCGNSYARSEDFAEVAEHVCVDARPARLACGMYQNGAVASTYANVTVASPTYNECCDYQCRR